MVVSADYPSVLCMRDFNHKNEQSIWLIKKKAVPLHANY